MHRHCSLDFGFGIEGGKQWTGWVHGSDWIISKASFWPGVVSLNPVRIVGSELDIVVTYFNNCRHSAFDQSKKVWLQWVATGLYLCEWEQDVTGKEQLCLANPPLVNRGWKEYTFITLGSALQLLFSRQLGQKVTKAWWGGSN